MLRKFICFGRRKYFSVANKICQDCKYYKACLNEVKKKEGIL